MRFRICVAGALALASVPVAALAEEGAEAPEDNVFNQGQIIITGHRPAGIEVGESVLSSEAIYTFNVDALDEAANLIPGVSAANTGGSRNERIIYVRGFDRFQVPVSIDGIRVYLPADNRLDYGRFLTPDIAEIQVAKGYASVLDGPGAMGGAINLVTRKPSKALELEARATLDLDRDVEHAGYTAFALAGTRHDRWYAQASFARSFTDHWDLPGGYQPMVGSAEDGGERDFSRTADWRVNAKIGFTPNDTDEYSISYTRQEGSKNAPLHVTDGLGTQRFWNWPYWNIESIYFLSTTAIADNATLKTRLYRNKFSNLLRGFDTRAQNSQSIAAGRVFNSWYDDQAYGGSVQFDVASDRNRFSLALHYRRDEHIEIQQTFGATAVIEPPQENIEDTWSIAAEDRFQIDPTLSLTIGLSYDLHDLKKAEEFGVVPGLPGSRLFSYPIKDANAWNAQGRIDWTPDDATRLYASVSSRARFPTAFERFSSRFGGAVSNPDLKAERATNFELGGSHDWGAVRAEGAVFYSHVSDAIFAFPFIFVTCTPANVCTNNAVTQSRNVGKGDYYGFELSVSAQLGSTLSLGANYTYTHRDLGDPSNAAFRPTGVPTHKAFAYANWSPLEGLHIVPSVQIDSDRRTVNTAGTIYYRTGSHAQVDLRIDYDITPNLTLGIGGRNLFDDSYQLVDGFPERGRSFFVSARARY